MSAMDSTDSRKASIFSDTPRTLIRRISGLSVGKGAAKVLGMPANTANKVKQRIATMIAAVKAEFDGMYTHEKWQTT